MTKMRWAAMGMMLLGAYVLQAFGCSSSPAGNGTGAVSGGDCCKCTITEPSCSRSQTYKPALHVNDCASFCAGQSLGSCSGSATATVTVSAEGAECGEGGVVPVGSGGGTGVGGSTGNPEGGGVAVGNLGAKCATDAQCTGGLICLPSSTDVVMGTPGGYPNGICTADCSADRNACAPFAGVCVNFDDPNAAAPKRICLEGCEVGTPPASVNKCHNRPDESCDDQSFTCQPLCTTDADCGTRKCSAFGMCTDTARMGLPLGSPCMTDMDSACAGGYCLAIEPPAKAGAPAHGICSGICVFGAQEGCDWRRTPIAGGAPAGVCFSPFDDVNGGVGDVGFCVPLCDLDTECPKTPGIVWSCVHTLQGFDAQFNHGVCLIDDSDGGAAPADAGGQ